MGEGGDQFLGFAIKKKYKIEKAYAGFPVECFPLFPSHPLTSVLTTDCSLCRGAILSSLKAIAHSFAFRNSSGQDRNHPSGAAVLTFRNQGLAQSPLLQTKIIVAVVVGRASRTYFLVS